MSKPLTPTSYARQPLDVLLSKPVAVRIMRVLLRHGGALAVIRIAAEARITPNAARTGLGDLVDQNLVRRLGSGRSQLYQIVDAHALIPPLRALFDGEASRFDRMLHKTGDAARAVSGDILAVWLFGSVARGTDNVGSDLDIALVVDAPDAEVGRSADGVRDVLHREMEAASYRPSIVAMSLADVHRMRHGGHRLWSDLTRDAVPLAGLTPPQVLAMAEHRAKEAVS